MINNAINTWNKQSGIRSHSCVRILPTSDIEAFAHLICVKTDLCCHGNVHTVHSSDTNPQQSDKFLPEIKQQSAFWFQQPERNN